MIRFRFIAAAVVTALVIALLAAVLAAVIVRGTYDCPEDAERPAISAHASL